MEGLIVRFLQGKATVFEERALFEWCAAAEENEQQLRDIERIWRMGEASLPILRLEPPDVAVVIANAHAPATRRAVSRSILAPWLARGVAAAALVGVGFLAATLARRPVFGVAEFKTGRMETVTVRLADGSSVRLAPESRLRVESSGPGRRVFLEGQAFFSVAEDARNPFYVRTRVGEARVLGTRFNLRVEEDDLQLLVVDGRVALAASGAHVELGANELSNVVDGGVPGVVAVTDTRRMLAWMGGALVFTSTPLPDVVSELEERYGAQIELRYSSLAQLTVSAEFAGQSFEDVMAVICRVVNARCTIGDNTAVMAQ